VIAQYQGTAGLTYNRAAEAGLFGERILESRRRLSVLGRWLPSPPGRFMEIGCGSGAFLAEMRDLGWRVEGLELSPGLALLARRRLGVDLRTSTLREACYPDAAFDAAGFFEVLSHLREPQVELRELARVVRPGGTILFETGNGGELRQDQMSPWGAPEHLAHYSERAVRRLLDRTGFDVLAVYRRALRCQRAALRIVGAIRGAPPAPPLPATGSTGAMDEISGPPSRSFKRDLMSRTLLFARYTLGRIGAAHGTPCTLLVAARRR
jgi:SAM-dependent methyltransferase